MIVVGILGFAVILSLVGLFAMHQIDMRGNVTARTLYTIGTVLVCAAFVLAYYQTFGGRSPTQSPCLVTRLCR